MNLKIPSSCLISSFRVLLLNYSSKKMRVPKFDVEREAELSLLFFLEKCTKKLWRMYPLTTPDCVTSAVFAFLSSMHKRASL